MTTYPPSHPLIGRSRFRALTIAAFFFLGIHSLFGWGLGHEDIEKAILEREPDSLKVSLDAKASNQLVKDSHAPDSFQPFDTQRIGSEGLKAFLQAGFSNTRYVMHTDKGRAIVFLNLVQALRDGRNDRANYWIACLGHSTADMAACNHYPLVHIADYQWADKMWNMQTPGGLPFVDVAKLLDFSSEARTPEGHQAFEHQIDEMRLSDDGADLPDALLRIMFYGYEGSHFCASRGLKILDGAVRYADSGHHDEDAHRQLDDCMADLGAWAVVRTLRDVAIAQRIAASQAPLAWNDIVQSRYNVTVDQYTHQCALTDDTLFSSASAKQAAAEAPAIGVLVEPTWRMNDSFLGFGERVLAAEIAFTLGDEQRPYRLLDIRQVLVSGFPPVSQMPVVVAPVRSLNDYLWMKESVLVAKIQEYLSAGGRVLWIGSETPGKALPDTAQFSETLPATPLIQYQLQRISSNEKWPFVRPPKTKAGWQNPSCNVAFRLENSDKSVLPLLQLTASDGTGLVVGLAHPSDKPQEIFYPIYAIWPHLFTQESKITFPAAPRLDDVGQKLLDHALDLLQSPVGKTTN